MCVCVCVFVCLCVCVGQRTSRVIVVCGRVEGYTDNIDDGRQVVPAIGLHYVLVVVGDCTIAIVIKLQFMLTRL